VSYQSYDDDSISLDVETSFLNDHLSRYQWIKNLVKDKSVLDCACGKGYGSYLISLTASETIGIDLNAASLRIAQERFKGKNLSFQEADVLKLEEKFGSARFDVVVAYEIIEHIPPETTEKFISEIKKVLKPGGKLILSTPNHDVTLKSGVYIPDFHINNFRSVELRNKLEEHFSNVEMIGQFEKRSFWNHLFFSLDFFSWRHLIRKLFKQSEKIKIDKAVDQNTNFKPIDSNELNEYQNRENQYEFSSWHWRQAGLTMVIAQGQIQK